MTKASEVLSLLEQAKLTKTNTKVEYWYDKATRSWIVQLVDLQGNQIGDAEYSADKKGRDYSIATILQNRQK
jgi:hypothetical protein